MKKKLIIAIVAVVLIACVSVTFSIWLGDVEKNQAYTISMTDKFMYLSSQNLVIDTGSATKLTPGVGVTHKFELKLKGNNAEVKLECTSIEFSVDGGKTYKAVAKDAIAVTFDKNNILVDHGDKEYAVVECKSTIKFLLPASDLDNNYENAKFRYTLKVSIAEKEVVNG